MTDRDKTLYPHARAFGEALGKSLSVCNGAPSKGTFWTSRQSDIRYRATFSNGVRPYSIGTVQLTSPIHADFEITVYARNLDDAEAFAEHYARDYVCALVAVSAVETV